MPLKDSDLKTRLIRKCDSENEAASLYDEIVSEIKAAASNGYTRYFIFADTLKDKPVALISIVVEKFRANGFIVEIHDAQGFCAKVINFRWDYSSDKYEAINELRSLTNLHHEVTLMYDEVVNELLNAIDEPRESYNLYYADDEQIHILVNRLRAEGMDVKFCRGYYGDRSIEVSWNKQDYVI
jgi:hypothetical protein